MPWNLEAAAGAPGSDLLWRGTWSSALSYNPNNAVYGSNGSSYVSKTNNQNKDPLSNPSDWDLMASGGTGPPGTSFTTTTANFDVPIAGASVVVTVVDASWMVVGQMVVIQTAGGAPIDAGSLKVTAKTGNQVTLQNLAAPGSGGDMLKAVYDVNNNNVVDKATISYGVGSVPIYTYQDHFLTGSDGSYGCWITNGTGATKAQGTSVADHPGIYQLATGTSVGAAATGYAFMTAGNGYLYGTAPGTISFRSVFKAPATKPTNVAAALSKIYLGLGTQPANGTYPGADFVGFVFDPSSGMANAANNWGILTRKASVNTYTDTGFAYSTTNWADLVIWLDSTGVWYKAFTWATAIPAWNTTGITSNIPLGTTPLCLVLHVLNGPSGTTSYLSSIDLWEIAYQPSTLASTFKGADLILDS